MTTTLSNRSFLLLTALVIFCLGLIMIYSTTAADILDHDLDKPLYIPVLKQLIYACIGGVIAWKINQLGYDVFLKISPVLLGILIFCLVIILIPGLGKEVNGSKRWINLLGFSFQPSEFVKIVLPAYVIQKFRELQLNVATMSFKDLIHLLKIAVIAIPLIMVEPNNGTAGVIVILLFVLLFLLRIPLKYYAWPILALMLIGGGFASQLNYVQSRIKVYLNPESDVKGKGHQPYQAKIAAGSGGMFGKGPGNSWQKLSYLPEAQNDYIAAIYAEEFGFTGICALIVLYMAIAASGLSIALSAKDPSGALLAAIISFLIAFQAFLNLGVVSGLLPSTGLNLPLFSQGGSSLMANVIGIGLIFDIGKRTS